MFVPETSSQKRVVAPVLRNLYMSGHWVVEDPVDMSQFLGLMFPVLDRLVIREWGGVTVGSLVKVLKTSASHITMVRTDLRGPTLEEELDLGLVDRQDISSLAALLATSKTITTNTLPYVYSNVFRTAKEKPDYTPNRVNPLLTRMLLARQVDNLSKVLSLAFGFGATIIPISQHSLALNYSAFIRHFNLDTMDIDPSLRLSHEPRSQASMRSQDELEYNSQLMTGYLRLRRSKTVSNGPLRRRGCRIDIISLLSAAIMDDKGAVLQKTARSPRLLLKQQHGLVPITSVYIRITEDFGSAENIDDIAFGFSQTLETLTVNFYDRWNPVQSAFLVVDGWIFHI
ncbi:hypothetical protein BGX33_004426 [Mortierella sp. NVP41]|nr:hypothetical protein BGX33_004426 [Mortierella sp. NVP41]